MVLGIGEKAEPRYASAFRGGAVVPDRPVPRRLRDAIRNRQAHPFRIRACLARRWSFREAQDRGAVALLLRLDAAGRGSADRRYAARDCSPAPDRRVRGRLRRCGYKVLVPLASALLTL